MRWSKRGATATSTLQVMTNEVMQGDEWATYSTLGRTTTTYRGMAYSSRGPGSRSAHSTRGSDAPPGRPGEPVTGGRSTGVCGELERGCARCTRPYSSATRPRKREAGTGKRNAVKAARCVWGGADGKGLLAVPRRRPTLLGEGPTEKGCLQYLAGGLLYSEGAATRSRVRSR